MTSRSQFFSPQKSQPWRVPVFREYLLGLGVNSVSKASINGNLTRGPGASVMIVIGGARTGGEMGEMGWGVAKSPKRWGKTSESGETSRVFWDLEDIFWELKMVLLKPCMVKWCWCYGVELAERPWWRWGFLPPQLVMSMFNGGPW